MLELFEHLFGFGPFAPVGGNNSRAVVFLLRPFRTGRRGFGSGRLDFGAPLHLIDNLNIAEAQFGKAVIENPLFAGVEVASGFLLKHCEQVDGMAGQGQIDFRLFVLFAEVQQAELNLGLHQDGFDQKREVSRWNGKVYAGVCHTNHNGIAIVESRHTGDGPVFGSGREI